MSMNKLFAIKDAADVLMTDIATGAPVAVIDYANKFGISMSSSTQYAKSKGSNAVSFSDPFEGTLTLETELADLRLLAMLLGSEVVTSSSGDISARKAVVVGSDATVTLESAPKSGSVVVMEATNERKFLSVASGSVPSSTEVAITGTSVKFDETHKGKPFTIFYIKESAKLDKITVYSTPRTKAYRMTAFTSIKMANDNSDEDLSITLFKVSPKPNVEFSFDATAPSSFSMEMDILSTEDGRSLELVKAQ